MAIMKVGFYIVGFTGLGYVALKFCELKQENLKNELKSISEPMTDAQKKTKLMMDVLKSAADSKHPVTQQFKPASDK